MDYNAIFADKYQHLNAEQRAAVDRIEGPVMVVAGPGTGKTQLLTMRVANILRQTDALPSNILCLTFTEAAATNMTERLSTIIGADAYKVEINTFHGFGSSIISRYGEYFYHGANYQPADQLTQAEIIEDILNKLPFDNPLRAKNKDEFTYLRDLQKLIGDLKKAAIDPDQLRQLTAQNIDFCEQIEPDINEVFSGRISVSIIPLLRSLVTKAAAIGRDQPHLDFTNEPKLANLFALSLQDAIEEAEEGDRPSTKPITAWKKTWLKKVTRGGAQLQTIADGEKSRKLQYAADIYQQYLAAMNARNLYDFGDMIINVLNAIHDNPDLKANLQEQYQYILVDEFQDTNDAQMRLLTELTDYDNQPNLMVVGDDDQAIYRFQGADISNIQLFAKRFDNLCQINLQNNYRSGADILTASQAVSAGITSRLTNIDGTAKKLLPQRDYQAKLEMVTATTPEHEFDYLARRIKSMIDDGTQPADIAVIARKHKSLEQVVPYLSRQGIQINYERQNNIFESPLILLILNLANLVQAISAGNTNGISQYVPLVLAEPAFGISAADFYKLSLAANGWGTRWIDQLSANIQTHQLAEWLISLGQRATTEPLNNLVLELIGAEHDELSDNADEASSAAMASQSISSSDPLTDTDADAQPYRSPIFDYYFGLDKLQTHAVEYLGLLNDVNTLLMKLREYRPDRQLKLADLLDFVKRSQELNVPIYSTATIGDSQNVQLMSAHGSKGREFPTVFIIDAESEQWGSKSRSRSGSLPYPANMPYGTPAGNDDDERRRLLYVAMTRAEHNLIITAHSVDSGKDLTALEYLLDYPNQSELAEPDTFEKINQMETSLLDKLAQPSLTLREALSNRLANYQLSATDLNTFTDVINAGPQHFLLYNLLHVPQGTSGALIFGNAIHHTMQQISNVMRSTGELMKLPRILDFFRADFDKNSHVLTPDDAKLYRDKGEHALTTYLAQRGSEFNGRQLAEQSLEAVLDGGIRIHGKIDLMEIDQQKRTIVIRDYKTGKGIDDFDDHSSDYAKAKARRYAQQLMFYKLLVENSKEYSGFTVAAGSLEFVEPDQYGHLYRPQIDYSDHEAMAEFQQLIRAVWQHILSLDLPDISAYGAKFADIVQFEDDLCAGNI